MILKVLFEIFLVVRFSGMSTPTIANSFLIQDKFCRNVFNQTKDFCQHLNDLNGFDKAHDNIRNDILAQTAKYTQYQNAIEFIPMVGWSLFVGSFLDKAENSTKWLLVLHIITEIFQYIIYIINEMFFELSPYYMLIGSVPLYFSGGMTTFLTTAYRFVILISTEKTRRIRLMLVMFALSVGMSIGQFTGGQLLKTNDLNKNPSELRTYWINYVTGIAMDIAAMAFLFVTIKYTNKDQDDDSLSSTSVEAHSPLNCPEDARIPEIIDEESFREEDTAARSSSSSSFSTSSTFGNQRSSSESSFESNKSGANIFSKVFDLNNVRETFACIVKKRPQQINFQIYTIYATYFLMYFVYLGMTNVSVQFCEKVYGWSSEKLSTVSSIQMIVSTVTVTASVMIFIKYLKYRDSVLIVTTLGITSLSQIFVGTFLSQYVYFIAMPFHSAASLTFVCIRNKLSNMITEEEVGRIFSMMATIESAIPLISSIAYSNMFALLISSYPGAVYHFSGLLYFITMAITIYEQYYCKSF